MNSVTIAELYTGKTLFPCTAKENRSQAQYKYITDYIGTHIILFIIIIVVVVFSLIFVVPVAKNDDYNWSNINKYFDNIPRMPNDAKRLIKSLLHYNPLKRASITQCLNFEFFTNVKLMDLSNLLSQIRPLHEYEIKKEQEQKSVKRKNSIDSNSFIINNNNNNNLLHKNKHFKPNK